jgi:hypothetical protein
MSETPDRQPEIIVDGIVTGHPLVTLEPSDGASVDITSVERWENADGSVFAFVTLEQWPRDGSVWEQWRP